MKILNKLHQISKAYVEGIYADTPANRKLGRVGMTYAAYAQKLKDEKEEQADKKYWLIQFDSGEEDIFTEDKMSKEKLVEEACKFAKDIAEANDYDEYKFDIQENTNDWEEEDFDKKQYDWLSIRAKKHNGKYEISVYDWRTRDYLRNDKQERERKNFQQKVKRDIAKSEKEFKERFGWMEEFLKYKEQQKNHLVDEKMKKNIQNFLRDKGINSFQLGYGGYLFGNKDSKGNYGRLSLSTIREKDLESIEEMLHEENINYKIEYKTMSSQKGIIKDVAIIFNKEDKEGDQKEELTEKEKKYLEEYVSGEMMWINQYLRDPALDIVLSSKEDKEFLETLNKVTSKKLGEKTTLYRSVDASAFFYRLSDFEYDALKSVLVYGNKEKLIQKEYENALKKLDKKVTDKGFVSTTKSEEVADEWGGFTGAEHPIVLKISTDENTKGYDLGEFDVEGSEQYEVLLGKNQTFEVKDIYGKNGNIYLDVNVK